MTDSSQAPSESGIWTRAPRNLAAHPVSFWGRPAVHEKRFQMKSSFIGMALSVDSVIIGVTRNRTVYGSSSLWKIGVESSKGPPLIPSTPHHRDSFVM